MFPAFHGSLSVCLCVVCLWVGAGAALPRLAVSARLAGHLHLDDGVRFPVPDFEGQGDAERAQVVAGKQPVGDRGAEEEGAGGVILNRNGLYEISNDDVVV